MTAEEFRALGNDATDTVDTEAHWWLVAGMFCLRIVDGRIFSSLPRSTRSRLPSPRCRPRSQIIFCFGSCRLWHAVNIKVGSFIFLKIFDKCAQAKSTKILERFRRLLSVVYNKIFLKSLHLLYIYTTTIQEWNEHFSNLFLGQENIYFKNGTAYNVMNVMWFVGNGRKKE